MEHEYSIAFINISFLTNQTRIDWHREQHWNDDLVRYTFSHTDTKTVTKMVYYKLQKKIANTYPCKAANHIGLFDANEECHWAGQK